MVCSTKWGYNIRMDLRIVYIIAMFISFAQLVIFCETTANKINKNFLFLFITTLISNFGYALSVYATGLEAAMLGNLVSYIGSIFTILYMLIVVVGMCNRRFFLWIRVFLFACAIALCTMIATTSVTNFFFNRPSISKLCGLTVINSENGPGMLIYIIYLGGINIAAFAVVINSIIERKKVSKRTLRALLIMLAFGTLSYLIPLALGIRLNFMPYTYIVMESIFIFLSSKVNTYDLPSNLMNVYKTRGGYGYIAFDNNKRFLGCDEFALKLFPKLDFIPIDSKIPDSYTDIIEKLHYNEDGWNWDYNCNQDFKIASEEKSAICTIHAISANNKKIGYLFELRDDTEQQNYIKGINSYNKELSHLVEEKTRQVTDMQDSIIKGMAIMVESRDNSTGGHILRTSDCIRIFAEELLKHDDIPQITENFCKLLIKAAPMHDLGKIAVDDSILRKPGKFDETEYEKMKKHAEEGSVIVGKILNETPDADFERIAVNVAHYHHEKWNGKGYPEQLQGEEIPLEARIMALADVFDALVSKRCYKEAKSFDEAFEIIKNDLGKHFDPTIGKIFIECRPRLEEYYNSVLEKN